MNQAEYVQEFVVTDPVSNGDVVLEVYRDPVSGALFAVDASFPEDTVNSPYNQNCELVISPF